MVKVKVDNIPPYKQSPASKTKGETQRIRKSFLKNEVEKAIKEGVEIVKDFRLSLSKWKDVNDE